MLNCSVSESTIHFFALERAGKSCKLRTGWRGEKKYREAKPHGRETGVLRTTVYHTTFEFFGESVFSDLPQCYMWVAFCKKLGVDAVLKRTPWDYPCTALFQRKELRARGGPGMRWSLTMHIALCESLEGWFRVIFPHFMRHSIHEIVFQIYVKRRVGQDSFKTSSQDPCVLGWDSAGISSYN